LVPFACCVAGAGPLLRLVGSKRLTKHEVGCQILGARTDYGCQFERVGAVAWFPGRQPRLVEGNPACAPIIRGGSPQLYLAGHSLRKTGKAQALGRTDPGSGLASWVRPLPICALSRRLQATAFRCSPKGAPERRFRRTNRTARLLCVVSPMPRNWQMALATPPDDSERLTQPGCSSGRAVSARVSSRASPAARH
jgi:hypothetical protein